MPWVERLRLLRLQVGGSAFWPAMWCIPIPFLEDYEMFDLAGLLTYPPRVSAFPCDYGAAQWLWLRLRYVGLTAAGLFRICT